MVPYIYNRTCRCTRCRSRALMAPAILITLGIVFLSGRPMVYLAPAILIVIGVVKILQGNAPADGHINPPMVAFAPIGAPAMAVAQQMTESDPSAAQDREEFHG